MGIPELFRSIREAFRALDDDQRNTFVASFLGWMLDAFDFFVVTFVVIHIAHDFRQKVTAVALAITITLMMRPLGALIFGILADRFGRRTPLMIDIVFYSVVELLTAFSPNFGIFFLLRALYGVGMGGEWGVGAAMAMEALPERSRGLFSGLLQEGYAAGYLLAAVVFALVYPHFGWRALFIVGVAPAFLVFFIRARVPKPPPRPAGQARTPRVAPGEWLRTRLRVALPAVKAHWKLFVYAVLLMTAFNYMSHGTQDLYPTFLQTQRHLGTGAVAIIAIIYNIGAILGGTLFGHLSQTWGRRRAILTAASLGILMIPLWAFAPALWLLAIGAFLMQFMVQGAWGVIPVHLNELSPPAVRGTFPGLTYQLGNLFAANAVVLEASFAVTHFKTVHGGADYAKALAALAVVVFVAVIVLTAIGHEKRGIAMATGTPGEAGAPGERDEAGELAPSGERRGRGAEAIQKLVVAPVSPPRRGATLPDAGGRDRKRPPARRRRR